MSQQVAPLYEILAALKLSEMCRTKAKEYMEARRVWRDKPDNKGPETPSGREEIACGLFAAALDAHADKWAREAVRREEELLSGGIEP